jgi:hypothetical protein
MAANCPAVTTALTANMLLHRGTELMACQGNPSLRDAAYHGHFCSWSTRTLQQWAAHLQGNVLRMPAAAGHFQSAIPPQLVQNGAGMNAVDASGCNSSPNCGTGGAHASDAQGSGPTWALDRAGANGMAATSHADGQKAPSLQHTAAAMVRRKL